MYSVQQQSEDLQKINSKLRTFFHEGSSKNIAFRKKQLQTLKRLLKENEAELSKAVQADFGKPPFETFVSETGYLINEIDHSLKKLEQWAEPEYVSGSLLSFPSGSKILKEPYGVCLIIAPWNYPIQLTLSPLIGAIAAGNCAVIKPSELTPNTSQLICLLIDQYFDSNYITGVEGGIETNQQLLQLEWDHIFFTGSPQVGKIVMKAAAEHLTPVTLELGGKSPCIVDDTANIAVAARKLAFGKFFNGGQTCIAPDYVLVHESKKDRLIEELIKNIKNFYGEDIEQSPDYARVINQKHFERLNGYLKDGKIAFGGTSNPSQLFLEPTLLTHVELTSNVMKEEIFGPVLPVITFASIKGAIEIVESLQKPLSFYLFTSSSKNKKLFLENVSFGGGAVNETLEHYINPNLPFGGVGYSGIGSYHGKYGFETFTHKKSILYKRSWIDIPLKYPPYKKKFKLIRKLFKIA